MDMVLENDESEENFDAFSRANLLLLPRDLLKDLKTLANLATLREEAFFHLLDLKNLAAMSEVNEMEIHDLQIKVKAKENEILKAVLEISLEKRDLCEGEDNEDWTGLDREMAEMEISSSMLDKVAAKGKFLSSASCLSKNVKVGEIVAQAIKFNALVTGEVQMEIVEECPSGSTGGILSPDGKLVLPERLEKIQSDESKMVEEEKTAANEMEVALGETQRFTTQRLNHLRKIEEKLLCLVSKLSAAHAELSKECEDPETIHLLAENLTFKKIQLEVVNQVSRFSKLDGKVKTKLIELNYNRNLFEPRLKLLKEVNSLTEKRQSCRSGLRTEETGPYFHHGKLVESSAVLIFC